MKVGPDGPANPCPSSSLSDEDEVDSESDAAAKKRDIVNYVLSYCMKMVFCAKKILEI